MIPLKLQIKNFLSYGPDVQTIDFSPYHLICLSGKNGHGKSALLDAITWALWGQARKTSGNSKADQGLLHMGQKHMSVILEFEVSNQHYRVRREFVLTKSKPFASLDFGILKDDQSIIALTDKTIKATQDKIEKTIGITYDSFINSAFLRQGQSNEFSKKSPQERKEILANILQLQQFEQQKKIAVHHSKSLQNEYKGAISIQEHIQKELESLSNTTELLQITEQKITTLQKEKKELIENQSYCISQKEQILQRAKEFELLQKQYVDLQTTFKKTQDEIQALSIIWEQIESQKKHFDIKLLQEQKEEYIRQFQILQEKSQQRLVFKEEYLKLKETFSDYTKKQLSTIEEKKHKITIELSKYQESLKRIELQEKTDEQKIILLQKDLNDIKAEIALLSDKSISKQDLLQTINQQEINLEAHKQKFNEICAQGVFLKNQLQKIDSSIKDHCSLCKQPLTEQALLQIQQHHQAEKNSIHQEINLLKSKANELKKIIIQEQEALKKSKNNQEESINNGIKLQEFNKQSLKLEKTINQDLEKINLLREEKKIIHNDCLKLQNDLNAYTAQEENIVKEKEYQRLQEAIAIIEKEAKNLQFNPQDLADIQNKIKDLDKIFQQNTSKDEQEKQAERRATIITLINSAQSLTLQMQSIAQTLEADKNIHNDLQTIIQKELLLQKSLQELETCLSGLLLEVGSLQQKNKKQKDLFEQMQQREKTIKELYQEMSDYQEIAKALGKDGIQALLIEQAIPEIEDEANEVLSRLTNNQTQIFIESLRDLKKGGCKETLDIKISDAFGLRDYEMFSGGEAFRIDFALRIGISKLLARKAGTTLQTIFIDEGFGSQDEEGLQLIMDNIYKIQDDFAKIIIVSHLQEMKDHFPVQFIVEKKRTGSCITIHEQG